MAVGVTGVILELSEAQSKFRTNRPLTEKFITYHDDSDMQSGSSSYKS